MSALTLFDLPEAGAIAHGIDVGATLIEAGQRETALHLVDEGSFDVVVARDGRSVTVGQVGPGAVLGEISLFAGGRPSASVIATTAARVRTIEAETARQLLTEHDELANDLAEEARTRVNNNELALLVAELAGTNDQAVVTDVLAEAELVDVPAGEPLFSEGERSDAAYLVISGRLSAIASSPEGPRDLARYGRGQVVGEAGLFGTAPRGSSVVAIRDSVLAKIPDEAFERLLSRHPRVMTGVARQVVERMTRPRRERHVTSAIAVSVTARTNARVFTTRLLEALAPYGSVGHLTSAAVDAELGRPGISQSERTDVGAPRLASFLHEFELAHELLVVELGANDSDAWCRRALGIADRVLIVASAECNPDERAEVRRITSLVPETTTVIGVLHHEPDTERPSGSAGLAAALGFDEVLHVHAGSVPELERVARIATSRAVGVVLGGGGARGFAHIGVVKALIELGVPIDTIAGSSIGAPLAAGIATGVVPSQWVPTASRLFANLLDYTVPLVSLIKAERITASIEEAFENWDFEDLWIPFRCVSTNLTRSRVEVHRSGPVAPRVRASVAIPGVMPPVPDGDDLLVDGGVLNNLPVDVLADEGRCSTIIAVDVAPPIGPRATADYGLSVSGWDALRASFGRGKSQFPGITAILMRSMLVGSMRDRNRLIAEAPVDLHLQLDLRSVGLLDFDAVEPVAAQGHDLAKPLIAAWLEERGGWR